MAKRKPQRSFTQPTRRYGTATIDRPLAQCWHIAGDTMSKWLYTGLSLIGSSHITSKIPCQDSFSACNSPDGDWVAFAVCDGAGSALRSEESAKLVSRSFANRLIDLSIELNARTPGAWINDFVIQEVLHVRNELRRLAQSDSLSDFHTTLVACLLGPSGGFLIHIGDGSVFGGKSKAQSGSGEVLLNDIFFISEPKNGEYANETFFITEGDWVKNLRITPVPQVDWVVLATDGGCAFCLNGKNEIRVPYLVNLFDTIKNVESEKWCSAIEVAMTGTDADIKTNDDKTILLCVRNGLINPFATYTFKTREAAPTISPSAPSQPLLGGSSVPATIVTSSLDSPILVAPPVPMLKKNHRFPRSLIAMAVALIVTISLAIGAVTASSDVGHAIQQAISKVVGWHQPKDQSPEDQLLKDQPPKDQPPKDQPPKDQPPKVESHKKVNK